MKTYRLSRVKKIIACVLLFVVVFTNTAFAEENSGTIDNQLSGNENWVCPWCTAILNEQEGFSPDLTFWECTFCHTGLEFSPDEMNDFDPETAFEGARFPGSYWYCDGCDAFLNIQDGFNDHFDIWKCTECGYENSISTEEFYDSPELYLADMGRAYTEDWYNFYITPHIYESDAKFSYQNTGEKTQMTFGSYTLGRLVAYGDNVNASTSYKKRAAFDINSRDFTFGYEYSGELLENSETDWCLTSSKDKTVDGIKLNEAVGYGCMIVQTSSDGENYETIGSFGNLLSDYPDGVGGLYELSDEEVLKGTFFKVIVAYQTHKKTGETNVLFVHNDDYDNRYHVEVYDFYIGYDNPSVGLRSIVVKENNIEISPMLFENSKEYSYEDGAASNRLAFGDKSLGRLSVSGQFTDVNMQSDITGIRSASEDVLFSYRYDGSLEENDTGWELADDKGKKLGDIDIGAKIGSGVLVFQHSLDGETWTTDHIISDAFVSSPSENCSYLYTMDEDTIDGALYRVIVAYQTRRITDTSKILFVDKDNYEYLRQVEVYTIYAEMDEQTQSSDIWDNTDASNVCGFAIDKMGTRYDVTVNGAKAEDKDKYVTNGEYTIVVTTPLGKTDSRTITVDAGYESIGEMLEETDDLASIASDAIVQKHYFDTLDPVNTGIDNGFAKTEIVDIEDPHFGWRLGNFTISGFSYKEKDQNGNWVFYRVPGDSGEEYDDNIVLQFDLKQNIDELDGEGSKYINSDPDRKDQTFGYQGNPFGRGTLLVRHEKADGQIGDTLQYTDYLDAKGTVNANTGIDINEEGNYEIALDYEIASTGWLKNTVYNDYRIALNFTVRNGSCAVYAFDIDTGMELENGSITENGFKLDYANSKSMVVKYKRQRIVDGIDGLTLTDSYVGFAKEGVQYTEPGLYTITAQIPSTGHITEKVIYVGDPEEYEEYISAGNYPEEEEE